MVQEFKELRSDENDPLFDKVIAAINEINDEISRDQNLTSDCLIGHSYFCDLISTTPEELHLIIKYDILPLLKEY